MEQHILQLKIISKIYKAINIDKTLIIGREEDADIILDELSVSAHHAKIIPKNNEIWVTDLGSTNGTLVNGVGVDDKKMLCENDLISIGDYDFVLKKWKEPLKNIQASVSPEAKAIADVCESLEKKISLENFNKESLKTALREILTLVSAEQKEDISYKLEQREEELKIIINAREKTHHYQTLLKDFFTNKYTSKEKDVVLIWMLLLQCVDSITFSDDEIILNKSSHQVSHFKNAIKKHIGVEIATQMELNKNYPIHIVISDSPIKTPPHQVKMAADTFLDLPGNVWQITSFVPGCLCHPGSITVNPEQALTKLEFWITPLVPNEHFESAIYFAKNKKMQKVFSASLKTFSNLPLKIGALLTFLLPVLGMFLDIVPVKDTADVQWLASSFLTLIEKIGGFTVLGILMGMIILIAILVFNKYFQSRYATFYDEILF